MESTHDGLLISRLSTTFASSSLASAGSTLPSAPPMIHATPSALGAMGCALSLAVLASCASPGVPSEASSRPATPEAEAVPSVSPTPAGLTRAQIHEDDLRLRIGILAHDSMAGRETGTPGKAMAGEYLAAEVARLGLLPGGDAGTFFQAVPLERRVTRVTLDHRQGPGAGPGLRLDLEDLAFISGLAGVPTTARTRGEGPVVWGGYLVDPSVPPGALAPESLMGAVVIVSMEPAPGVEGDAAELPPRAELATLFGPMSPASAVVLVADGDIAELWDQAVDQSRRGAVTRSRGEAPLDRPPVFLVHPQALERLLGGPVADHTHPVSGLGTLAFTLETTVTPFQDRNVIAIVPGADPELSGEFMTLGAHYDHLGIGPPIDGDSIYNGAQDNASGTAALLEVAEFLAHLPESERPRRSILFIWNAAEEAGLLGSEYFTDFPTVPRDRMVAHLNLDGVGRNHPDTVFLVGSRRLSTDFGAWIEAANDDLERPFFLNYAYDTPGHPDQIYCRSDHWSFARHGIPSAMIGELFDDYHKPSDTADRIDYEKMTRVSHLTTRIALRVANAPGRPFVDGPVPDPQAPCAG
jgi:hypothetical protein